MIFKGIDVDADIIPVDEDIVERMEKFGINKIETRYHVLKNYHNKITTIYNLLLKEKIDSGKKSISDMQSELYNEYINDQKNKIIYYGNLESVLKNRIGGENKTMIKLPNWNENDYENNNENMIIGDSGSVMERLIKAGKFTFDEENMCLNKVTYMSNKPSKKKENVDDGDSKYKTISSIKTNNTQKIKKFQSTQYHEEKMKIKSNHKVHFKYENENEKNKEINNSLNLKKVKTEIKSVKKEEDEDWYKEMEKLIDEENIKKIKKVNKNNIKSNSNNNNNYKQIRATKTTKFTTNKNHELKVSSFYLDKENEEFKKYQNQILSPSPLINKFSNIQMKKMQKKKVNNNNNNNNQILTKKYKSNNIKDPTNFIKNGKVIKKEQQIINNVKGKIMKKRQKSLDKNLKNKFEKNIGRGFGDYPEMKERRRNQSFQKRNKRIKI